METEKTVAERLKDFMDHVGMSNSQFADTTGISRPTLSQLLHGRNKSINDQFLRKINECFPELDIRWLLFGSGTMLSGANSRISGPQNCPENENSGSDNADSKGTDTEEPSVFTSSPELPKEISAIVNGVSGAKNAASAPSPAPDSRAAEPFVYEVRPVSENDASSVRGDAAEKKEAAFKKVTSILVLYSDGSFETFTPA